MLAPTAMLITKPRVSTDRVVRRGLGRVRDDVITKHLDGRLFCYCCLPYLLLLTELRKALLSNLFRAFSAYYLPVKANNAPSKIKNHESINIE